MNKEMLDIWLNRLTETADRIRRSDPIIPLVWAEAVDSCAREIRSAIDAAGVNPPADSSGTKVVDIGAETAPLTDLTKT